jgi:3-oxoacyl-(acyl-carrier-protein) synthase
MDKKRRVVITGIGVVAPSGIGKEAFWEALKNGKSGIKYVKCENEEKLMCLYAGIIDPWLPNQYFSKKEIHSLSRFSQFGLAACKLAVNDANLSLEQLYKINAYHKGVSLGTTTAGLDFLISQYNISQKTKKIHPYTFFIAVPNACASQIAIFTKSQATCKVFGSACAASTDAIGYGYRLIQQNQADMMFVGGSEAPNISFIINACYHGGVISKKGICRTFDKKRDGMLLGEGAGILILEELQNALDRGANIYCEIVGYGTSCDAYHMVKLIDSGEGINQMFRNAIADANIYPEEVEYINVHGTGTIANDKIETKAIKDVFGEHAYKLAISSIKPMIGHLQGAAGSVEAIATVLALHENIVPPTMNYENFDSECNLDCVPNYARSKEINVAISENFGFGEINSALVFKKYNNS